MIGIERWLDVLSILVIVGILGTLLSSMRKRGVRTRSLSEKPALFLEFTGKQVSVRRKKSRILPSYREQTEARNVDVGGSATGSGRIRISRTLAGLKEACLATRRDSLRVLREGSQRAHILTTATAHTTNVTATRLFAALRARLEVAKRVRVAGPMTRNFSSGIQERVTEIRQRLAGTRIARLGGFRRGLRAGHSFEQSVKRLRQGATDVLLYLDYSWYRLERSLQSHRKQFKAVTSRLTKTRFKELHVVRVLMVKTRNGFAAQERVQTWLREASSVVLQHTQDLATGSRTLQDTARGYIRRLSKTENPDPAQPQPVKSTRPASPGFGEWSAAEPIVLSLTSSGTLKLKSRLEDERTSLAPKSAVSMSGTSKGATLLNQVSVRYVGATQRRHGDPPESRQSKQATK